MTELAILDLDDSFQIRVETREDKIQQYMDYFVEQDGWGDFPPIKVVYLPRTGQYVIADGVHRYNAAKRAGLEMIPCEVTNGDYWNLLEKSIEDNGIQGIDMGPKDWRHFRRMAMEALSQGLIENRTMTEMAKLCKCSIPTITNLRKDMESEGFHFPETSVGADGKERKSSFKPRDKQPKQDSRVFCANEGCGTPIWDEMKEQPGCTYVHQDGHWFCCEECYDEWITKQRDVIAGNITGIKEVPPPLPTAKIPTKPNPSNYPDSPSRPVSVDDEETDFESDVESFSDEQDNENIYYIEIPYDAEDDVITETISDIFENLELDTDNINNIINELINIYNITVSRNDESAVSDSNNKTKWKVHVKSGRREKDVCISQAFYEKYKKRYGDQIDLDSLFDDFCERTNLLEGTEMMKAGSVYAILLSWIKNAVKSSKSGKGGQKLKSPYRDAGLSFEDMTY